MDSTLEQSKKALLSEIPPQEVQDDYLSSIQKLNSVLQKLGAPGVSINVEFNVNFQTTEEYEKAIKTISSLVEVVGNGITHQGLIKTPRGVILEPGAESHYDENEILHVGALSSEESIFDALKLQELEEAGKAILTSGEEPSMLREERPHVREAESPEQPVEEKIDFILNNLDPQRQKLIEKTGLKFVVRSESSPLFYDAQKKEIYIQQGFKKPEIQERLDQVLRLLSNEIQPEAGHEEMNGIQVYTNQYVVENYSKEEISDIKAEVDGALLELDPKEIEILKKNNILISIGDKEVLYPVFNKSFLKVGIGEEGINIVNAIRTTVIPALQKPTEKIEDLKPADAVIGTPATEDLNDENTAIDLDAVEGKGEEIVTVSPKHPIGVDDTEINLDEPLDLAPNLVEKGEKDLEVLMDRVEEAHNEYIQKKGWREKIIDKSSEIFNRTKESEAVRTVLANKVVRGYLKMNKYQRLAMTTAIIAGGMAGFTSAGLVGAGTYAGARLVRGAASFGASGVVNALGARRLNALDEKREQKIREIESSTTDDTDTKEAKKTAEQNKYERDKKSLLKKRAIGTVVAGIVGGSGVGFLEHAFSNTTDALETAAALKPKINESLGAIKPIPEHVPTASMQAPEISKPVETFSLGLKPEEMKVEIEKGDSLWKSLRETLEHDEKFKALHRGRQENIIANVLQMATKNPAKYGLPINGEIHPGETVDFSKVLGDEKVEKFFDHAIKLSDSQAEEIAHKSNEIAESLEAPETQSEGWEPTSDAPAAETPTIPVETAPQTTAENADNIDYRKWLPDDLLSKVHMSESGELETLPSMRSMGGDVVNLKLQEAVQSVKEVVNAIYTEKGLFSSTLGTASKSWGLIKTLPITKVLEYSERGNAATSVFKPDILEALSKGEAKHGQLINGLKEVMKSSKALPHDKETVESYLIRLASLSLTKSSNPN